MSSFKATLNGESGLRDRVMYTRLAAAISLSLSTTKILGLTCYADIICPALYQDTAPNRTAKDTHHNRIPTSRSYHTTVQEQPPTLVSIMPPLLDSLPSFEAFEQQIFTASVQESHYGAWQLWLSSRRHDDWLEERFGWDPMHEACWILEVWAKEVPRRYLGWERVRFGGCGAEVQWAEATRGCGKDASRMNILE